MNTKQDITSYSKFIKYYYRNKYYKTRNLLKFKSNNLVCYTGVYKAIRRCSGTKQNSINKKNLPTQHQVVKKHAVDRRIELETI